MAEYIERDGLLSRMRANFQQGSWYGCEEPMYSVVEETILEYPAAEVAPVRHGRWKLEPTNQIGRASCRERVCQYV